MGQGDYSRQQPYFHDPKVDKPIEDIYADLDSWTYEIDKSQPSRFNTVSFYVVLPPVFYEGRFIKGFYYSESVDLLNHVLPNLSRYFFSLAYSMWCSYPWSQTADAYSCLYNNRDRARWFFRNNPVDKVLMTCYNSDFINEYIIAPKPIETKDIDLLCVSRIAPEKNLPMIARGLKVYRQKYQHHIKLSLIAGDRHLDFNNFDNNDEITRKILAEITSILGNPWDYINFIKYANNYQEMPAYYSRSRAYILGSLLEGKNRSLSEAMSCNIPVICFEEFNQYARGGDRLFPEAAGLCAQFDPESLADTIHQVLANPRLFKPRLSYLKHRGRKNFFNTCLTAFPYYQQSIPDYHHNSPFHSLWLDLAIQDNYQMSLYDFLYGRSEYSHLRGLVNIYKHLNQWLGWLQSQINRKYPGILTNKQPG
ncbi:glycosyltransferase [Arthrospira platensis]|uniref:glycosyltransferase n=1 Tax=Limnospira TaxID=2596745 RepID=UPI0001C39162|nr:glycosyltransferase [Arthrospira platensis]KDR59256.1 glycosyl transferase family 1 [Arthrospira platensis str. Paraca]MBD2669072.1 glycosyltransferase [Arthrospira platensis FACHB-439]MBD2709466.1 glycosyltransferase [Arthrospira platensis FACHB-835]MDT9309870.1 glycosyltransferase [Limnospira sp. Paracas R14]QQW28448.1 glycosyltransferase [Arthrospira sp. PCC 9108]